MQGRVGIVGTRQPAPSTRIVAAWTAREALSRGLAVVSGGAAGVDEAALEAAGRQGVVVFPWSGFRPARRLVARAGAVIVYDPERHPDWAASVDRLHPAPERLGPWDRRLLARNYGIVTLSDGIVAFPRRDGRGGTWQAVRAARELGRLVLVLPDPVDETAAKAAVADFLAKLRGAAQGWRG